MKPDNSAATELYEILNNMVMTDAKGKMFLGHDSLEQIEITLNNERQALMARIVELEEGFSDFKRMYKKEMKLASEHIRELEARLTNAALILKRESVPLDIDDLGSPRPSKKNDRRLQCRKK